MTTIVALLLAFVAAVIAARAVLTPLVLAPGERTTGAQGMLDGLKHRVSTAAVEGGYFESLIPRVQRDLARAGRERENASDWLGSVTVTAVGAALIITLLAAFGLLRSISPIAALVTALIVGVLAGAAVFAFLLSGLTSEADLRARRIVRLLPYGIELIILVAESGGGLEDGMNAIINSLPKEPLAQEFARVLAERQIGRSLADAFTAMDERLKIKEVTQLVTTIEIGRELGTPTAASLTGFAEWLRVKRLLDGEKMAREAAPKMTFPNTLIMMANVILILAPFMPQLANMGGL